MGDRENNSCGSACSVRSAEPQGSVDGKETHATVTAGWFCIENVEEVGEWNSALERETRSQHSMIFLKFPMSLVLIVWIANI